LPDWIDNYREKILEKIGDEEPLLEYALFHDCGKPLCKTIDEQGKQHFPNHAEESYKAWIDAGGSEEIGQLIKMDMDIHLLKANGIEEFCKRPQAIQLLLSGLAEIHSNANMFGGIDSISFKIKWKNLDRRGSQICKKVFE